MTNHLAWNLKSRRTGADTAKWHSARPPSRVTCRAHSKGQTKMTFVRVAFPSTMANSSASSPIRIRQPRSRIASGHIKLRTKVSRMERTVGVNSRHRRLMAIFPWSERSRLARIRKKPDVPTRTKIRRRKVRLYPRCGTKFDHNSSQRLGEKN